MVMKSFTLLGGSMIFPDEYNAFVLRYYGGFYPLLRFGQAFVNEFVNGPDPDLFYEEDEGKAKEVAWQKYVRVTY